MLLELVLGCLITEPIFPNTLNIYFDCVERQEIIDNTSNYHQIVLDNFEIHDVEQALRVIWCESSGQQYALNKNNNETFDKGIWQFNDKTWAWLTPKLKLFSDPFDIEVSTKTASWLVYNDGWHHWNASKKCWSINE